LYQQGDYDGAIAVAKKALQTAERELGPDHFNVAARLNNLAEVYREQGQYAVAKPLLKRALVINEKALGPGHIDVAMNLNNLASFGAREIPRKEFSQRLKELVNYSNQIEKWQFDNEPIE